MHTETAHIFMQTEDGMFMINRFRLGKTIHPLLRKIIINDGMAKAMAEHRCIEHRNTGSFLSLAIEIKRYIVL